MKKNILIASFLVLSVIVFLLCVFQILIVSAINGVSLLP